MYLIPIVTMLLAAATSFPGSTPSAPGAPRLVQLVSLDGLPPDSLSREEFLGAFRGVFAEEQLDVERLDAEQWRPGLRFSNRFRLLEGTAADDVWSLQVVVGAPPPVVPARRKKPSQADPQRYSAFQSRRSSRGMMLSIVTVSPAAKADGKPGQTVPYGIAFPIAPSEEGSSPVVPAGGYVFPWDEAGRAAGRLALETLHRGSGDLGADERFRIAPAVRAATGR